MDFISNREKQNSEMLRILGVESVEDLFASVPRQLFLPRPGVEDGMSEFEALKWMEQLARKNRFPNLECYLGAGAYEHHVPALVAAICSKSEFLTSYTPYQPEISQGMLQVIFEYQSAICALTGMDVANASVYDGASACAEAILLSLRSRPDRNCVVISGAIHPHYRQAIRQYVGSLQVKIRDVPYLADGQLDLEQCRQSLDSRVAAVLIQSPNFFGVIEPARELFSLANSAGAISILCANPIAYGLFASAREVGADIAVGDSQPFGLSLQFGGPYVGYMAVRQELVRQLPGRLVGETVDTKGRRGYVLTLQAREQHIRREKATSNLCTNQALAALASLVAILWYGPEGVRKLALTCYQRANYLRDKLRRVKGIHIMDQVPIFNEFVLRCDRPINVVQRAFQRAGIAAGVDLGRYGRKFVGSLLVAVTETKSLEQLDHYVMVAHKVMEDGT